MPQLALAVEKRVAENWQALANEVQFSAVLNGMSVLCERDLHRSQPRRGVMFIARRSQRNSPQPQQGEMDGWVARRAAVQRAERSSRLAHLAPLGLRRVPLGSTCYKHRTPPGLTRNDAVANHAEGVAGGVGQASRLSPSPSHWRTKK